MKPIQPYQPLLLRLLHGLTAITLGLALFTALWTYNTYDGRWGQVPLPDYRDIEGIHGTFGLWALLIFPAFLIYAFHAGQRRLLQPNSWEKLTQIGQSIWWYTLNRFTNTLTLVALTFALFSGKMMDETWLPKGELDHRWYYAHLISWVTMVVAIALHLLLNAKVGGVALLVSMWTTQFRAKDHPQQWPAQIAAWWSSIQELSWISRVQSLRAMSTLEILLWLSLIAAWGISIAK